MERFFSSFHDILVLRYVVRNSRNKRIEISLLDALEFSLQPEQNFSINYCAPNAQNLEIKNFPRLRIKKASKNWFFQIAAIFFDFLKFEMVENLNLEKKKSFLVVESKKRRKIEFSDRWNFLSTPWN